jgi:hypothetical protein
MTTTGTLSTPPTVKEWDPRPQAPKKLHTFTTTLYPNPEYNKLLGTVTGSDTSLTVAWVFK